MVFAPSPASRGEAYSVSVSSSAPHAAAAPKKVLPTMIVRLVALCSAFIAMCVFAAAISYTNANFINLLGNGDWTDGLALAPAVLAIAYNLVAIFAINRRRSLHPAVFVAFDLLVWALSVPALVFSTAGGMFWAWTPAMMNKNGVVECDSIFNQFSTECNPVVYTIGRLQIAGTVFLALVCVLHLGLWANAVRDLHRRRRVLKSDVEGDFEMQFAKDVEK